MQEDSNLWTLDTLLILAFALALNISDIDEVKTRVQKAKCKVGRHVRPKYFCLHCKKPKLFPKLRVVK